MSFSTYEDETMLLCFPAELQFPDYIFSLEVGTCNSRKYYAGR